METKFWRDTMSPHMNSALFYRCCVCLQHTSLPSSKQTFKELECYNAIISSLCWFITCGRNVKMCNDFVDKRFHFLVVVFTNAA